jgi:hypothetical protein
MSFLKLRVTNYFCFFSNILFSYTSKQIYQATRRSMHHQMIPLWRCPRRYTSDDKLLAVWGPHWNYLQFEVLTENQTWRIAIIFSSPRWKARLRMRRQFDGWVILCLLLNRFTCSCEFRRISVTLLMMPRFRSVSTSSVLTSFICRNAVSCIPFLSSLVSAMSPSTDTSIGTCSSIEWDPWIFSMITAQTYVFVYCNQYSGGTYSCYSTIIQSITLLICVRRQTQQLRQRRLWDNGIFLATTSEQDLIPFAAWTQIEVSIILCRISWASR